MASRWTKEETEFLNKHWQSLTDREIALALSNRTEDAIKAKRGRLSKQKRPLSKGKRWALDWDSCQECETTEKPYAANGLCCNCYYRKQYRENPKIRQAHNLRSHNWRKENHEKQLACQRKWAQENRERVNALARQCYHRHKEMRQARSRKYRQENPEIGAAGARRYYARMAQVTVCPIDDEAIFELYNHTCIYCGTTQDLTLDHIVPISKGGAHRETNLVVACRSCNASKKAKSLMAWIQCRPDLRVWLF